MAADDELERIKEQKKAEMADQMNDEESGDDVRSAPNEPIHVEGESHLEEVTSSYDVVLVDFYADWCGPCKMLEPIVESLAADSEAAVAKVDVDANQPLAAQYQVQGVPTMLLFADGEPVERIVGVRDQSHLQGLIQQYS
ncbi:thioredoxin [Haloarculaceae archaeon H-GB2-1]|nr:thioredoxin [Haloarculaceae archaeon H-GB1-1]MEA5388402.1 thioredoxin [Haloarculaceae archaeon H-GB11]MEA5406439.1 thioredoxin [Haloarculaceae archaeon H-GB2-1]